MRIALTGGIASGKSVFTAFLRDNGIEVLDVDDVVHILEAKGGKCVNALAHCFGKEILAIDGGVDRRKLAARVFSNEEERKLLESIVLPVLKDEVENWLSSDSDKLKIVAVPTLFEQGWQNDFDCIICLVSSPEMQIKRLMERRGLTVDEAKKRLSAQWDADKKASASQYVVVNNGSLKELKEEAFRITELLKEEIKNERNRSRKRGNSKA